MIVYNLGCANDHRFEGWFSSADDYEQQTKSNLLNCPLCGNNRIARMPHAPYLSTGSVAREPEAPQPSSAVPSQYTNVGADLLAKLIDRVLEKTEDVGRAFPEEARKIHYGETPERHIRGNASAKEVNALREEGIDVVALPIPPHRLGKTH